MDGGQGVLSVASGIEDEDEERGSCRPHTHTHEVILGLICGLALLPAGIALGGETSYGPFEWAEADGGNGHSYELIDSGNITWPDAKAAAEARGGYLATITSPKEDAFLKSVFDLGLFEPWFGLWQNTDSPDYSEPNNSGGEDHGQCWYGTTNQWNDYSHASPSSYLIEYAPPSNIVFFDNFDQEEGNGTNYTDFAQWTVVDGCVDLYFAVEGNHYYGDWYEGNHYLDLDGSCGNAGTMQSDEFTLTPGGYALSFDVPGYNDQGGPANNAFGITLGAFVGATITQADISPESYIFTYTFTVTSETQASILVAHAGGDGHGLFFDNVKVERISDVPLGGCCIQGTCLPGTLEDCFAAAGSFAGVGVMCDDLECPTLPCPGDTNGDGSVGVGDVLTVIGNWGPCP